MTNKYKLISSTLLLILMSARIFSQIPNSGFENWQSVGFPSYLQPNNWGTLNSSTAIIGVYTAERADAANSHSGSYAMKLSTKYISFASQTAPGITVSSATINTSSQSIDGGFVYTQRPTYLSGWIKGTPAANDSSQIELSLWKWIGGVKTEIGSAKFVNSVSRSSYIRFLAPITYSSPSNPDSALITLSSSNTDNPVDGSVFYVDDLEFVNCNSFTATTSSTNATCTSATGSATITATGATSFQWSNSATTNSINNVAAGTYNVTASDANGCSVTASVTVSSNTTILSASVTPTATTCGASTGSATVSPSNGTPSYTYNWSNGGTTQTINNLAAGSYQVTITDANGCSGTASTSVTTPNGPSATQSTTSVTCNGAANGAIDVTTTGGTGNLTYAWSPSGSSEDLTGLSGGTYTLTVTDGNNCSFTISTVVNEPAVLTATTSHTNVTCYGADDATVTITVAGGTAPYSYFGNPVPSGTTTFDNLAAGTYAGNLTDDNGCTAAVNEVVTQPDSLIVSLTATDATSQVANDGAVSSAATGGTSNYTYTWSNSSTADDLNNVGVGNYCVTVTDQNGCTATACKTVSAPSAIGNVSDAKISAYPNPANSQLIIETGTTDKLSFAVYTIDGKLVNEKTITGEKVTVDVKALPVGFYSYQLKNVATGNVSYGKLQIQR